MKISSFSLFVVLSLAYTNVYCQTNNKSNDKCIIDSAKRTSQQFLSCFKSLGGCQEDTSIQLDNYCYCEPSCFSVYELSVKSSNVNDKIYLIEILKGIGKVGNDYWIVTQKNNRWIGTNYFTGYLTCILPTNNSTADIIFQSETDHGRATIQLTPTAINGYYRRKAVIDVEGADVTSGNKAKLLEMYNSMPESSDIGQFEPSE